MKHISPLLACREESNIGIALPTPYATLLSIPLLLPSAPVHRPALPLLVLILIAGCSEGPRDSAQAVRDTADPQILFWDALNALCGRAFAGSVTESVPPDDSFEGQPIVMHVRSCDTGVIRIPFHVGDDRSRTWVITSTAAGLRLQHDHRHEDGSEDDITQYGGDTRGRGESTAQDFYADGFTAALVPTAAPNVWTVEIEPGRLFAYALRRGNSARRFRVEFDLTKEVAEPLPPWGG